jgi:signal transduction histidine kinase
MSSVAAATASWPTHLKTLKRVSFFAPFVLGLLFYFVFWPQISFTNDFTLTMFALSTTAVAFILAGTYFFAYKFFEENFYFFIFTSWIANAVYLIPDMLSPKRGEDRYLTYEISVTALSLVSSVFVLLALFTRSRKNSSTSTWREVSKATWTIVITLAVIFVVGAYIYLAQLSSNTALAEKIWEAQWKVPTSALSFVLLWALGYALKLRLSDETPDWKVNVLAITTWAYAGLQLCYPITAAFEASSSTLPFFLVAQVAKVGNAISLTGLLQLAITSRESKRIESIRDAEREVRIKESRLAAQEEKLQSNMRFVELGMLASAIKHDVQTPLATMGFDISALRDRFQHDPKVLVRLETLVESMQRIEANVKVVDIFRGDKIFFDKEEFMTKSSMLEIAHRAVRSVKNEKEELKQSGAKNRITVRGRDVWVRAYVAMFEQLLVNVIKNGLEAIEEAERESGLITVTVGLTEIEGSDYSRWAKVEIEDNGCGIPPENMDKLTTIFTTRGDKKPNSGIGLFIGRKILEIHDGDIKFKSEVGVGTTVTVLLPEWNAIQKADQKASEKGSPPDDPKSIEGDPESRTDASTDMQPTQAGVEPTPQTLTASKET